MHRLWARATISAIEEIAGTRWENKYKNAHRRECTVTLTERTVICPLDPASHTATSHKQRRLAKFAGRLQEAAAQQKHKEKLLCQGKQLNEQTEVKLQQL